ncbi:hypothetical protein M9Y10_021094 [Tritrichomonas musculus]|uniref:TPR Domain containing protein n=1 Tax=Tritrichomonas musculus TaxID=1915356 RepID=A0ABR2HDV5_9EUKA
MSRVLNADKLRELGNTAFSRKDYQEAIQLYTQAIQVEPNDEKLFSNRSGAFTAMLNYVEAECDAYAVIRLNPKWVKGYTRLGNALIGEKRWDDAIYALQIANKIDPDDPRIPEDIKNCERSLPEHKNQPIFFGVPLIFEMIKSDPKYSKTFENPQILRVLRKLQDNPASAPEFATDHEIEELIRSSFDFMNHNLDYFEMSPQNAGPNSNSYRHSNQAILIEEAKKNKSLKSKASIKEDKKEALNYKEKGNQFFHEKDYGSAIFMYSKAINNDPENATFYSNRSAAFTSLEFPGPALEDANKAIQIMPSFIKAYTRKAHCYFDLGEYIKSYQTYEQALVIDPKNSDAKEGIDLIIQTIHGLSQNVSQQMIKPVDEPDIVEAVTTLKTLKIYDGLLKKEWTKDQIRIFLKNPLFIEAFQKLYINGVFTQKQNLSSSEAV